jgi:hypothetical protein
MFFDLAKTTISKALGSQGPSLLFHIGVKVQEQDENSLWTLYEGTKKVIGDNPKDDGQPVSVFIFDIKTHQKYLHFARNAFRRSKTIRYPDCLKYIDGAEVHLFNQDGYTDNYRYRTCTIFELSVEDWTSRRKLDSFGSVQSRFNFEVSCS